MDSRKLSQIDVTDPVELRRYEARLGKRLQQLGFHLSKGPTIQPGQKIRLKKGPVTRGYQITDVSSNNVVLGMRHELTLQKVERFWEVKHNEVQIRKYKEKAELRRKRQPVVRRDHDETWRWLHVVPL